MKAGPNKGQMVPIVTRDRGFDLDKIQKVYLSPKQDDYIVIFFTDTYAACLEVPLKTEFVTTLSKKYNERVGKELKIMFDDKIEFVTKKGKIGGDKRVITFLRGQGDQAVLKVSGIITKDASVSIGEGLPNDTRPKAIQVAPSKGRPATRGGQQQGGRGSVRGGQGSMRGRGRGGGFSHRPAPDPSIEEDDTYDSMPEEEEQYDVVTSPPFARGGGRGGGVGGRGGGVGGRGGLGSVIGRGGGGRGGGGIPGPPSGPMPARQPTFQSNRRGSNRASRGQRGAPKAKLFLMNQNLFSLNHCKLKPNPPQAADPSVFAVPSAGVSGSVRASINTRFHTLVNPTGLEQASV